MTIPMRRSTWRGNREALNEQLLRQDSFDVLYYAHTNA
jgi:hypothetical protein